MDGREAKFTVVAAAAVAVVSYLLGQFCQIHQNEVSYLLRNFVTVSFKLLKLISYWDKYSAD
jgi:hypothetical protein